MREHYGEGIERIFGKIENYHQDEDAGTITFRIASKELEAEVDFDKLTLLSMLLNTRHINLVGDGEDISTGVTKNTRSWVDIRCSYVRF